MITWRLVCWMVLALSAMPACKDDSSNDGAGGGAGMSGDAVGAPGGAAGMSGGAAGSNANPSSACAKICALETTLACPGDTASTCESKCETLWTATKCQSEFRAFLTCGANQPASGWECDEMQEANVKAGLCDDDLAAVGKCTGN
jgi:hypothetical protein